MREKVMHTEFWKENLKGSNDFEGLAKDGGNSKMGPKTRIYGM
jgi:hypothetical protein